MSHELIIEWITTKEQILKVQEFATSCGHEFYFNPSLHKMFVVKRKQDGQWVGWVKIPNTPLMIASWHKDHATPRDVSEGFKMINGWAKLQFGEGMVAVPNESKTFTEPIMEKLGTYSLKSGVYATNGIV